MTKIKEHTMKVFHPVTGTENYNWNGKADDPDRVVAAAKFQEYMGMGIFLAYATVGTDPETRKATQIREFDPELENITLTPRLAGG